HRGARPVRPLDGREHDLGTLRLIHGVRGRKGLAAQILLERLDELLAGRRKLLERLTGIADVHALRRRSGGERRRVWRPAVGADEYGAGTQHRTQVLQQLRSVVADDPAQIHGVGVRPLDAIRDRFVASRLLVPALEAEYFDPQARVPDVE